MKTKMSEYNFVTLWKIWIFLFVLFFLLGGTIWYLTRFVDNQSPQEQTIEKRSQQLSMIMEQIIYFQWVDTLKELILLVPSKESDVSPFLESWIARHEEIVCTSVWTKNKRWPIRVVQNDFMDSPIVTQLSEGDRQNFYNFIFQDESALKYREASSFSGPIFIQKTFGFPILSIGISSLTQDDIEILEAKIKLDNISSNFMQTVLQNGESITISDSKGDIIFSSKNDSEVSKGGAISDGRYEAISRFHFLPWTLLLEKANIVQLENKSITQKELYAVFVVTILLITLSGLLLTRWIDKPFNQLVETVAEVARGKFEKHIPSQKNQSINRLIKIFNYMAEEMYNLQKIDVGEIVNEKNKTETILRNIADGVVVTDSQDRILVINSIAEKWFGLDEKDVIQKPIQQHIENQHLIALLQAVKDGQPQSSAEFSFSIVEEHEKKIFQANAARIHNQENKFMGVVTVIRDVTKVKEADRIKTELVSMVAHELKSPLTSIYGFSELLLDSKLKNPKAEEYARVILTESTRLTDLVNKFLDISRLEAGRTEIRINPFNMKHVVNKIVDVYKGQAEKKHIRVIQEIPEKLSLALGDQDMIEQVLLNLFSNAIKYSPPRSKIGIEVKEEEEYILINVIDNGYGIPEEALPKIFDKFFRVADLEGSDEIEGSGLGLSLSKEIVERHGGTINVTSRFGVGSVFNFTLPKAEMI